MADDPVALNSAGLRALGQGDSATAIALLRRAVAADPQSALLWFNLATAFGAADNREEEGAALDNALDREPYFGHALFAKGYALETAGDMPGALGMYIRLLAALDPNEQHGPGFAAGIAHARGMVTEANSALAARLDAGLAAVRAAIPAADRLRFEHCVDIGLGRRKVYNQQPLVLAYPYLPQDQFFDRRHFPWLAELEAATPFIRAELQALLAAGGEGFAPYVAYPPGAPVNQWATLNHSDAWAAQFMIQHGVRNQLLWTRCPQTAAVLERLPLFDCPGRGPVAFFSLLKPHTHIPPHTGATNIRTTIHLPLIVPKNCSFRVGNETRTWVEGEAFVFDDTIEHEAINGSDELRAVFIVDSWNPHLTMVERDLLRSYVAALDATPDGSAAFD